MNPRVYVEAVAVGAMTLVVGGAVSCVFAALPRPDGHWNRYHYMETSLVLTGVLIHLGCEASGLNAWYCRRRAT